MNRQLVSIPYFEEIYGISSTNSQTKAKRCSSAAMSWTKQTVVTLSFFFVMAESLREALHKNSRQEPTPRKWKRYLSLWWSTSEYPTYLGHRSKNSFATA